LVGHWSIISVLNHLLNDCLSSASASIGAAHLISQ
jgi:hypothetical protein